MYHQLVPMYLPVRTYESSVTVGGCSNSSNRL